MKRKSGTKANGQAFSEEILKEIFSRGEVVEDMREELWRRDTSGLLMYYPNYGDAKSSFGWVVDHIIPVIHGGGDRIDNLQPLNIRTNKKKGESLTWVKKPRY